MERSNFEKLHVDKLAERLADEIGEAARNWDKFSKATLGKQIVRAAKSIGANTAEGTGRGSFQDNRRLVRNERESLNETRQGLRRAHKRYLLTPVATRTQKSIVDEPAPRLNACLHSIGKARESRSGVFATGHGPRTRDNAKG